MKFSSAIIAFVPLLMTSRAGADIILDVSDLSFVAGGTGSVDVTIRSTSVDVVDFYAYRFEVSGIGAPVGTLRFADPQSTSEGSDPNYLFGADSLGVTTFAENPPAFDAVSGTDLTFSGLGVAVGGTDMVFARLEFEHILPGGIDPNLAAGDQFLVSLVDADTMLLSDSFDPGSLVTFAGNSGTLSAQSSAVPEPSGLALLVIMGSGWIVVRRKRNQV